MAEIKEKKVNEDDVFNNVLNNGNRTITEDLLCATIKMLNGELVRKDNAIKRYQMMFFVVILIILGSFIYIYSNYEILETQSSYSQDVNDGGNANFIGNDGDITNAETSDSNKKEVSEAQD